MRLTPIVVVSIFVALAACVTAGEPPAPPPMAERSIAPPTTRPLACDRRTPASCVEPSPSFARDVSPIIESRCLSCHANGGVAADDHDFSRFATLRAQKDALLAQVGACAMPPTQAPALESNEADVILRWLACGAQQN